MPYSSPNLSPHDSQAANNQPEASTRETAASSIAEAQPLTDTPPLAVDRAAENACDSERGMLVLRSAIAAWCVVLVVSATFFAQPLQLSSESFAWKYGLVVLALQGCIGAIWYSLSVIFHRSR